MDITAHIQTAWRHSINNALALILLTLVMGAISVVSLGILAPAVFAGYVHALLQLIRYNRTPRAGDVFSQLRLFFPLMGFGLLVTLLAATGFLLFIVPGVIVTVLLGYGCLYMIPLMVDQEAKLFDAIRKSLSMVTGSHLADQIVVFILFAALTTIGGSSLIGFLLLQPFATLFLLSVYDEIR